MTAMRTISVVVLMLNAGAAGMLWQVGFVAGALIVVACAIPSAAWLILGKN